MIEKIKNFMNGTTDLISYSEIDDYSNFWKDLKPIKYESPIEILKKYADNFNVNSSLSSKFHFNIEINNGNSSESFRSVKLIFTVSSTNTIFYCREILKIFQDIETLFPITIKNYLDKSKDVEIDCYSIEEFKKELNRILYSEQLKTIITNIVTYYTYL